MAAPASRLAYKYGTSHTHTQVFSSPFILLSASSKSLCYSDELRARIQRINTFKSIKFRYVFESGAGCNGVCIMSTTWKDEQHPSFINFISSFLDANSYRLNFVPIAPDFIFNCGGVSVAFIFATNWDFEGAASVFSRIQKLRGQFAHFYVIVTLPTKDLNDSFMRSYFKYGMEFGRPTFIPVQDLEMGFEKIVKVAHARGVCKRHDAIAKLRAEREKSVQSMDIYIKVLTSIPGIDSHDANSLNQAIGSIETIAKASKEYILENTDLSTDKAETVARFFRDPKYYLGPKIK